MFVHAAGGYYYPGKDLDALRAEMRSYVDRGYTVVKMKAGVAPRTVPGENTTTFVIYIRNGRYEEKLVVQKPNVTFLGERRDGFANVRLVGYRDTAFPSVGRHHFSGCEILGHVDFIAGAGEAATSGRTLRAYSPARVPDGWAPAARQAAAADTPARTPRTAPGP